MINGISVSNKGLFNTAHRPYYFVEALLAFACLAICFAIILPDLFFLRLSPMGGSPSAIKDPSVSWAAFMPAFREFRYELFEHGNILWSNLRSLGLPMLGNGVQGAPLFPLNLSLVWLPDALYWSIMPVLRVILIALGAYVLCRRIFGLSLVASLCFALLAGFNVNVMRWINHPWQNGLLAGLWYTYFCCTLFLNHNEKGATLFWHWLGLVLATFGMITNGFPEASALAALFAAFLFIAFISSNWSMVKSSWLKPLTLIIIAHIVGLSLSAVQIFALLEFIDVGAAMELREGFIGGTYKANEATPFLLSQFSHFWLTPKALEYLNFSIGLFGTFFLIRGLCLWLKVSQRPWIGIACLAMMALYIVKSFGLLGAVEFAFANTPVLAQSHFPLYFSPLFYLGAAYFVALGIESYLSYSQDNKSNQVINLCISIVAVIIVLLLCAWNIHYYIDLPWFGLIEFIFTEQLRHFLFFVIAIALLISYQLLGLFNKYTQSPIYKKLSTPLVLGTAIILCFVIEMSINHFDEHAPTNHFSLGLNNDLNPLFDQVVENSPLARHELRSNDRNGDYVSYGIATINNGVSAILPPDQRKIRTDLFQSTFAGYFPIDKSRRDWSWEAISSNIVFVNTTPIVNIDWSEWQKDPEIKVNVPNWQANINMSRGEPFYLEGVIEGLFNLPIKVTPWIHFQGNTHSFWVEGNVSRVQHLSKVGARYHGITDWRIRIPDSWLLEDQYQMTVRIKHITDGYADAPATQLNLTPLQANNEKYKKYPNLIDSQLVGASPNKDLHVYYNPKALPRAYLASQCTDNVSQKDAVTLLRQSDAILKGHISVENINPELGLDCSRYAANFKAITITSDRGSEINLSSVKGPALVALNDYYYPGWKANDQLSGEQLEIIRSNSIFRAVYLPENRDYRIQMNYQPEWLRIVYLLLVLALIMLVSVWWYLIIRKTPPKQP